MRKEHTKLIIEKYDENMNPTSEVEETIVVGIWADQGKLIRNKLTGLSATGVEFALGEHDVDDFEEIEDPNYVGELYTLDEASEVITQAVSE